MWLISVSYFRLDHYYGNPLVLPFCHFIVNTDYHLLIVHLIDLPNPGFIMSLYSGCFFILFSVHDDNFYILLTC